MGVISSPPHLAGEFLGHPQAGAERTASNAAATPPPKPAGDRAARCHLAATWWREGRGAAGPARRIDVSHGS